MFVQNRKFKRESKIIRSQKGLILKCLENEIKQKVKIDINTKREREREKERKRKKDGGLRSRR